jgi:hypothetical protein
LQGDDFFTRAACPGLAIHLALRGSDSMLAWLRSTLVAYPAIDVKNVGLEDRPFKSMLITHVLIGQLQDPNNDGNKPFIYTTVNKQKQIMWRTYAGLVQPGHCQVFVNENIATTGVAATDQMTLVHVSEFYPCPCLWC